MRLGLIATLLVLVASFLASCGSEEDVQGDSGGTSGPVAETIEVTREVTVEKTVVVGPETTEVGGETGGSGETSEIGTTSETGTTVGSLPGPAVPGEADIQRTMGETAALDSGNSITLISGQSGVPSDESVYQAPAGMDFFVIEAEVCVPEDATEPSYFTPREFNLLNDDTVRRMASVPTLLPALRGSSVEPGECNRGYITFQVEDGEEPQAVIYEGSSVVEWELGEG